MVSGNLDVRWIHGSPSAKHDRDPEIQVHHYDEHTVILRQNMSVHYEAPFLYLLLGDDQAVLVDSGATPQHGFFPLRATVDRLLADWLAEHPCDHYQLVVAHSHSHGDHTAGDIQFADRPDTTVLGADLAAVTGFFGLPDWPEGTAQLDLGGRIVGPALTIRFAPATSRRSHPWRWMSPTYGRCAERSRRSVTPRVCIPSNSSLSTTASLHGTSPELLRCRHPACGSGVRISPRPARLNSTDDVQPMARAAAPSALGFAESSAMEEDEACRRLHPRTDGNAISSAGAVACERTPHRRKGTPVRKTTYTLSIVLGSILIIGGVATWILVSTTLADQKITVSDDASCLAGDEVDGPFSAYCEAMVIDKHALEATGGLRYAELEQEDPKRQTAQTASFLQASLFTSVVAFGVAAMAIAIGVLFILIGLGIRDVANRIDVASRTPATA